MSVSFLQLAVNYGYDDTVTRFLDSFDIYIVPLLNVDGYDYTWTQVRSYDTVV